MTYREALPKPRRVLMTADPLGGVWTYALDLSAALGRLGVQVFLATMGAPLAAEQRAAVNRLDNLTVFESTYKLEWMKNPWEDVARAGEWLLWLERHLQPDIIHLNHYVHAALPWGTPVLVVAHGCMLSRWRAVYGADAPIEWNRYWYEVGRGVQNAQLVVAPSRAMLSALRLHYGPLPNARVIYHGRSAQGLAAQLKEPFILSAGRLWDAAKNSDQLRRVAPQLEWPVYLAGEQHSPEDGPAPAGGAPGAGAMAHARWLGRLGPEVLAGWMGRASIFCLPARYEPFGLAVLEAALSGCALVLGAIPSLRELWSGVARFVPPNDPQALARTLRELSADPAQCQALGERARLLAQEYSLQRMSQSTYDAYREMMSRQSPVWEYLHHFGDRD